MHIPRPKYRSPLRKWLGKQFFVLRRKWQWYFGSKKLARQRIEAPLTHQIFQHRSPLLRKLKDVDMYLQHNKVVNLQLAANRISGIRIQPGETFSFWYLVGEPTKRKGYLPGMMLSNGQVVSGTGGGLCQMGNLIFWMALHSPLEVSERWRHSYDVFPDVKRSQPFGSGATLAYNYIDLQLTNSTKQNFQIQIWLSDTHLEGGIYSDSPIPHRYVIEERNHQILGEPWGGYSRHNQIFRQVYSIDENHLIQEELVTENHAIMMYQPFLDQPTDR